MIGSQALIADPRRDGRPPRRPRRGSPARWSATPTTRPADDRGRRADARRSAPGPTPARADRRARAPRRAAGTGRPPGSGGAGRPGPARGPSSRSAPPAARVRGLQPGQLALPADDLLLGRLADRAGVDDDEVGRLQSTAPRRSRRPAAARPSPRSRSGSSGSRASRRGSAAAPRPRAGTRRGARRRARPATRGAARRRGGHDARASAAARVERSIDRSWLCRRAYAEPGAGMPAADLGRDPQLGVRLGVRAGVAVVVGAAGRDQAERRATSPTATTVAASNER